MSEEIKTDILAVDYLSDAKKASLPGYVKAEIDTARIIGSAKRTIELSDGRRYSLDNTINDLTGTEWTKHICSVINTRYSTKGADSFAHNIRRIHPTPKPPQLMREIIEFFTKENEIVFDYFMGVGGSLLGASLCNRRGAGIDLNSDYINAYKAAAVELKLPIQPCLTGDCNELLSDVNIINNLLGNEKAGLILIDPPYSNMMSKPKTGADAAIHGNYATPFTDSELDIGNMSNDDFLMTLKSIVEKSLYFLKEKGYLIIFCKDLQPKKKDLHMLHAEIAITLNEIPRLYYRGLKIWADQTVKLFPYGYPFDYVANQIHQYILIFRKH